MGRLSGAAALSAGDTSIKVVLGVAGSEGVRLQYNKAGQRIQAVYARDNHREDYKYGVEGYLEDTYINANDSMQGTLASKRVNDLLGRTTNYYEYNAQGGMTYERSTVYSTDGRQLSQTGSDGQVKYQYYNQLVNGNDSLLAVSETGAGELAVVTTTAKDGTVITNYTAYDYWDEAKQRSLTVKGETAYKPDTAWRPGVSSMAYDVNGHLKSATDAGADGKMGTAELDKDNVTFSYISNAQGLVLRREQYTGDKVGMHHRYLYLNGAMVGDVGNDGDARLDYAQSLGQAKASREEMYKNWTPISSADFDQNYQPINRTYPAATGSTYVVKAGDSLYAIAGAVWGDVSMWYLIAEANGITAETPLTPNQTLTIPNKVTNIHNNSGTSRPYDAGAIIGDLSPTLPEAPLPAPPPQKSGGGCGGLGMIIMAVIAVVVTVYAGPQIGAAIYSAATGTATTAAGLAAAAAGTGAAAIGATAATMAGMAAGAALGSIASQMAGVAMGMQDKINWNAVGVSALSAAILPNVPGFSEGSSVGMKALNGAIRNVASQGIAIATGLQEHFSWKSIAVSAISAPTMSAVKAGIGGSQWAKANIDLGRFAQNAAAAVVSSTVNMVVTGGRISWAAVTADAIGSTIVDSQLPKTAPSTASSTGGAVDDAAPRMPTARQLASAMASRDRYREVISDEKDWLAVLDAYDRKVNSVNNHQAGQSDQPEMGQFQSWSESAKLANFDTSSTVGRINGYSSDRFIEGVVDNQQSIKHIHTPGVLSTTDELLNSWQHTLGGLAARGEARVGQYGPFGRNAYDAIVYVPVKVATNVINGFVGLPRLLTNKTAVPDLVNAIANPTRTVGQMKAQWDQARKLDKIAGVATLALAAPSIAANAGRLPVVGKYLGSAVGYSRQLKSITLQNGGDVWTVRSPIAIAAQAGRLNSGIPVRIQSPFKAVTDDFVGIDRANSRNVNISSQHHLAYESYESGPSAVRLFGVQANGANNVGNLESLAARRSYLNDKFGRTDDLNQDINYRGVVENLHLNADAAAKFAVGTPRTYGRFGTKAHTEFERLNELTNQRIVGTDYSIVPEQFRGPSVGGGPGLVTIRRAAGSMGIDALVQYRNVPQIGFDLKTGRGWSPSTVTQIQQRFGVPIREIYTP